jgi:PTS system nitrogen regulatory IIA component
MFPLNFITTERIACGLDISSKKRVLQRLGEMLASSTADLRPESVFEHLLERERLGSTGLGHGIALPHARMPNLERAVGAFVQLSSGVDFDAVDDHPVDLAFGLLVPQAATEEHLQLLAKLASMFSNELLCEKLRNGENEQELLQRIEAWDASPPAEGA